MLIGLVFEVAGALSLGGNVAKTISKGVIDPQSYKSDPNLFALCMPAVLAGAAFSCVSMTIYGIPVSITKGVVFGLSAAGLASVGSDGVSTGGLVNILIALVTSPLVGAVLALLLYGFVIAIIKKNKNPF